VPVNHGGNALAVLLALALLLASIDTKRAPQPKLALFATPPIFILAIISNKIFIIQAALPAIATISLFLIKERFPPRKLQGVKLLTSVTAASLAGYFLSKELRSGCNPPIKLDLDFLSALATDQLKLHLETPDVGIGILILLSLALIWATPIKKEENIKESFFRVFATTSISSNLILAAFISQNSGPFASNSRYLLSSLLLSEICFLVGTIKLIKLSPLKKWNRFHRLPEFALAIAALVAVSPISAYGANSLSTIKNWENPYTRLIQDNTPASTSLLSMYEGEHYLSSRSLKAGTNWKIHVSQIASNGEPNPWDQGKSEFYQDQDSKTLRDYGGIIIKDQDVDLARSWYGEAKSIASDQELGVQLWLYDEKGRARINKRISTPLNYGFKVECD